MVRVRDLGSFREILSARRTNIHASIAQAFAGGISDAQHFGV
jgi:hypothetical protein